MPMHLQINGEPREVPEGVTVTGLLAFLNITTGRVAVEVNAAVVGRSKHTSTLLHPGDQVEIVTFVGGG